MPVNWPKFSSRGYRPAPQESSSSLCQQKRLKINVINAFPQFPQEMAPQPPWPPSANLGHPKRSIQGACRSLAAATPDACAGRGDPKLFLGDPQEVRCTDLVILPVFVNTNPLCFQTLGILSRFTHFFVFVVLFLTLFEPKLIHSTCFTTARRSLVSNNRHPIRPWER